MKLKLVVLLVSLMVTFLANEACASVPKCGDFTFTGSKIDDAIRNGVDMDLSFDFKPDACGSKCTCDPVCYIQIVRTVDMETFAYLYPSTEKQDRANANGWYIDRDAGYIWGYYGRRNDGTFAVRLNPGSDTEDTVLSDSPTRREADAFMPIWWQAVSVPACIQSGSACENKLLGYYFWSWYVDDAGVVFDPIHAIAWRPLHDEVDTAVAEWNLQAPGLGNNTFPAFSRLAP